MFFAVDGVHLHIHVGVRERHFQNRVGQDRRRHCNGHADHARDIHREDTSGGGVGIVRLCDVVVGLIRDDWVSEPDIGDVVHTNVACLP